ncbi:MAG: sugar ABC transporter permease [Tepidisphaeraceae bacterium]|jgi:multiple sugar transport system permease protein
MAHLKKESRDFLKGMAFISPWLFGFGMFMLLPIGLSFYFSFCDYPILKPPVFIGADNYRELMHDPVFWAVIRNSLYYAVLALPAGLIVSLGIALLLNRKVPGQSIFRTIVFLPSLVPTVATAILWMWLYDQKYGLINSVIRHLDLPGPGWLTDYHWVIPALALMSVWGVGNTVVIYLAGLQDVPRELYEAAELDGAGPIGQLFNVTLPFLSPVIFFNLVIAIIGVLQVFDAPYIMTDDGGPDRASYFFTNFLYDSGFTYVKMGYASALAWIQFLVILALTGLAFWSSRRWVYYQGK